MDAAGKTAGIITGLIVLIAVPLAISISALSIDKETEIMKAREEFVKQAGKTGFITAEDYLFVSSVSDFGKGSIEISLIKPAERLGHAASDLFFTKTKKEIENELQHGDIRIPKGEVIYVGR